MERHKRKLCSKSFSSGRALGRHTKMTPGVEDDPKTQLREELASSSSTEEEEEQEEQETGLYNKNNNYGLRENPKRSARLVDPEFSSSIVLQDRESETESSKNPTRERSKRTRIHHHDQQYGTKNMLDKKVVSFNKSASISNNNNRTESSWVEPEPVSSVSDTTTEEDVAFCLMMLSRDSKWKSEEQEPEQNYQIGQEQAEQKDGSKEMNNKTCNKGSKGKFRCETCNKWFKSYQALGGHRASHKKYKIEALPSPNMDKGEDFIGLENAGASSFSNNNNKRKIHECSFCFRVFSSGQALGGHKRSHGLPGGVTLGHNNNFNAPVVSVRSSSELGDNLGLIDLNLPAPVDDDDFVGQYEVSAVPDGQFR